MDPRCRICGRRLPGLVIDGQAQLWCRHCKELTLISVPRMSSREMA